MRLNRYYILAFSILTTSLGLSSCEGVSLDDDNQVHLKAGVYHSVTKSGGSADGTSGVMDAGYSSAFNINLVRIDENSNSSLAYPFFLNCQTPLTATVSEPDGDYMRDVKFSTAQYYRNNSDYIRYASWYPTSGTFATGADSTTVTFDIDGATDIMYGSIAAGSKDDAFNPIQFNHALCQYNIYAYRMTADDSADADMEYDWGTITDIVIKDVQKKCILSLPHTGTGLNYNVKYSSETIPDLFLKNIDGLYWNPSTTAIPSGFGSKEKVTTYLAPPPTKGYLNVKVHTSTMKTEDTYQQISIARNFQAGCAYDIILRFTSHGFINAEVSLGNWTWGKRSDGGDYVEDVAAEMYYDLSAYYSANSYVVPAGSYGYSFRGDVKGNDKNDSSAKINPGYIGILWCDNENIWSSSKVDEIDGTDSTPGLAYTAGGNYVQLASHTLSENRVMFKVGNVKGTDHKLDFKGNLVIAAYDHKGGNILWTWHIWLTSGLSNVGFTNGYSAMNMNLGATSETGEGLYYQWGRKDPFSIGHFTTNATTTTVDNTVLNPQVFYGASTSSSTWCSETNTNGFWGWTSDNADIKKSMYDPCPPGYFVADYRFWSTPTIGYFEDDDNGYTAGTSATVEITNTPVYFNLSQGYLDATGAKATTNGDTNAQLFLWSSSMDKAGTNPYAFYYTASKTTPALTESHRNYGGAIRCLSKSASVVKDLSASSTSNCYIISKDGYYKFKANVIGNGATSAITNLGNEWDISGAQWGSSSINVNFTPSKVDYLWYQPDLSGTVPSSIETSDLCLSILNSGAVDDEGYAYLSVDGWEAGNYLLAAYDASGKILWSWHFWLTDEPEDEKSGDYTTMDRNLGATHRGSSSTTSAKDALATYGFYYQWGRKDPIPGPGSGDAGSASDLSSATWFKYDTSAKTWAIKNTIDEPISSPTDIVTATQNPTVMILNSSSSVGSVYHWLSSYSNIRIFSALWGYAIEDNTWGTMPGKSCYDPCPVGYKVTNHLVYWGKSANRTSSVSTYTYGYSISSSDYDSSNWYPRTGRRYYSDGKVDDAGSTGYYFMSVDIQAKGGRILQLGSTVKGLYSDPDVTDQYSCAYAIRCMKQ